MAEPTPPPGPDLVTVTTDDGHDVALPAAEAQARLRAGDVGFRSGQQVTLRDETGQLVTLSGAEAAQRLGSYTQQLVGQDTVNEEARAKEWGGGVNQVGAAAAGLLRGASGGLSDKGLIEAGRALYGDQGAETARQRLNYLSTYNRGLSQTGEVVGTLGGLAAGAGGLARGAVGAVAPRVLGRAAGLATAAAGGAAEMGVMTAGSEYSRQVLANEAASGEKLAAAFAHGALLGGVGMVGLGAAGALLRGTAHAGLEAAASAAERASGQASTLALGERLTGTTLGQKGSRLLDAVLPGGTEAYAAERALKATGGTSKQIGKVLDASDAVQAKAQRILDEDLPAALGKEKSAILSRPEMAEAMPKVIQQEGEKIGGALRKLDQAGAEGPSVAAIAEGAKPLIDKLAANPFAKGELAKVSEALDNFGAYGVQQARAGQKVTFEGLHDLSSKLGEQIRKGTLTPEKESLSELRKIVEAEIEAAGDRAASKMGGEFAGIYREAKQGYAAVKMLEKAVKTGVERESSNATQGLREMLGGLGGSNIGSHLGSAVAGPVGGLVGGAVVGAASSYLANLSRRYGDQAVASLLRRATAGGGDLTVAAVKTIDDTLGAKAAQLLRRTGEGAASLTGRTARAAAAEKVAVDERPTPQAFKAAQASLPASPQAAAQRVAEQLPPGTPPGIAQAAQAAAVRGAAHLQTTLPKPPGGASIQPQFDKREVPRGEQEAWLRRVKVVQDPTSVIDRVAEGKITREEVETLKAVYPSLYQEIRLGLKQGVAGMSDPLPYQQALALGALFGVAAHPSQKPAFVAAIQKALAPAAPQPGPAGGGTPAPVARRPINTARLFDLSSGANAA